MSIQNRSNKNNQADLQYLLRYNTSIHSVQIDAHYFHPDDYDLLKYLSLCLCSTEDITKSVDLDYTFNTLVAKTISADTLIQELIKNHSLKVYVIDSLKRYNSLMDIIHILPSCADLNVKSFQPQDQKFIVNFLNIIDSITKSILLTTTMNSLSIESQRYFGNFIKRNDLPVPFSYYTWNKEKNFLEYKVNFNILAEIMCLTNGQYVLQIGSQSTMSMGKTSLLQYIFPDKRLEILATDGSSNLRNGCIDVLFSTEDKDQKNESYVIFDVHGTINAFNEDIITSIQHYSSVQILYVTEEDLNTTFLSSMMNYSKFTQEKSTVIIIFDSNYDDKNYQAQKVIEPFQSKYRDWKYVKWLTASPARLWYLQDSNKKNKDLTRSKRLRKSFDGMLETASKEMKKTVHCTSIFSIQTYYLDVKNMKNSYEPVNYNFEIQNNLNQLFGQLNDTTENLRIVTPVTYLDSAIKQCETELAENWDIPHIEIQTKKDNLNRQRSTITTINAYTRFFLDLLTKRPHTELLITENYLEKWRSRFESPLQEQLTKAKNAALKYSSHIKQLEERLAAGKSSSQTDNIKIQQELNDVKSKYNEQRALVISTNEKLMNIDLTIGLFCDEIIATYELSPRLFNSETLVQDIAKALVNLMSKGFAIHILRGRPLRCQSKLIEETIKFIQTTQQPPLVLTVIGEQSSAKSSLMNTTFGCNFRVSPGRCTIGMYMSVIQWRSETIIIFDTEGLLSLEESGSIFDNQMVTMAILSSHLVLINHKGEFSSNLKDLIGISFYAKLNIRSPIKPKLLFVLRDQADLSSNHTFFRQLTQLKEQLQIDSQFLKSSIDDELDINHENVYLLPNAISHEINSVSGVTQCWRNQLFPNEIIKLRDIIFENITKTTKPQNSSLFKNVHTTIDVQTMYRPETPTIDPAYVDMTHLYGKVSSNWEAIDRLGPKLLQCRTLYELSIMEELQGIAYNIIREINVTVYREGYDSINQTLLIFSENNFIGMNRDNIMEKFNHQLDIRIQKAVTRAQDSYDNQTERSCYIPEIKLKVRKLIEPPILSAKHLLKNTFEENLNNLLKKHRLNNTQKQLLDSVQREFDQCKSVQTEILKNRIEDLFKSVMEQHRKDLQSSCETDERIMEKILRFYNEQLSCKQGETSRESIYNLLSSLPSVALHRSYLKKFEYLLSPTRRQQKSYSTVIPKGLHKVLKSLFTGPSDSHIDSLWADLKPNLNWFTNASKGEKKLFADIWSIIDQQFDDLLQLTIKMKSFSSDPKTIEYLFQYIENIMNSTCIKTNSKRLQKHVLCFDLAVIGLHFIMDEAITMEKLNYESNLQNSINEMEKCKKDLLDQCSALYNAFESGKTLAKTIGTEIMNEIGALLRRRIEKEIKEDIVKNQFINHDAIQKQAYEESFTQGNGENILKYVYDINRYFIELSLREIRITLHSVIHTHALSFRDLFISVITTVNDCVQRHTFQNTKELRDIVRKEILQIPELNLDHSTDIKIFKIFSLDNIIRMKITQANEFKLGFKSIGSFYGNIDNQVDDITKLMKVQVLESCKASITQKLSCQVRCPGCGAKCSKPEPHEEETVELWPAPCEKCPKEKCICERPQPKSLKTHETKYHTAGAFYGCRYYKLRTPCLELCYQRWATSGRYIWKKSENNVPKTNTDCHDDDNYELVSPLPKYYSMYHPDWYNNLENQSKEGNACTESIPPSDQRRAWMIVRHTLLNRYKASMIDRESYDEKLYPHNVDALPSDFEPEWNDATF
jgi:hypothetical protein